MPRLAPSLLALLPFLAVAPAGCSLQGEGERCQLQVNGNDDCEANLRCWAASELRGGKDGVDRCCPLSGGTGVCAPKTSSGAGGTGGAGGAGGTGGTAGGAGSAGVSGAAADGGDAEAG